MTTEMSKDDCVKMAKTTPRWKAKKLCHRQITIVCIDDSEEFTSVERDMIEEFLQDSLGLRNITIETTEV